jgi:hypothetical protein
MAESHKQAGGNGDGRSKAGGAFEERAEAEGYKDHLNAAVLCGVLLHPATKKLEFSGVLGEVVEPEGCEDDPEDRPERVDDAVDGAPEDKDCGHLPEEEREQNCGHKSAN